MHVNRSCLWSCARLFNEIYPNLNKLHTNPHIQHHRSICTSFLIPVVRLFLLVANWIRDMMYLYSKYKNTVDQNTSMAVFALCQFYGGRRSTKLAC